MVKTASANKDSYFSMADDRLEDVGIQEEDVDGVREEREITRGKWVI